jgi:hypothetical protein
MAKYTLAQLKAAAKNAGFTGNALTIAVAVSLAENGGMDTATTHKNSNGSTDYGAWQINSVHSDLMSKYNVRTLQGNADAAYAVYKAAGNKFTPWTTYKSGSYRAHLTAAQKSGTDQNILQGPIGTALSALSPGGALLAAAGGNDHTPLSAANNAFDHIADLITHLSDPAFWKRLGLGLGGFALIIIGIIVMVESNKTVRSATEEAVKVAAVA